MKISFLKTYTAIALVIAAILSPLSLSPVPILILAWYLYQWRWPFNPIVSLLTEYFSFFAFVLLFNSISPFSLLVALPLLALIDDRLIAAARFPDFRSRYRRSPTANFLTMAIIAVIVLIISLLFGNPALSLAAVLILVYLVATIGIAMRGIPVKPAEETKIEHRMLVGTQSVLDVKLRVKTKIKSLLFFDSPFDWVKIDRSPAIQDNNLVLKVTIAPTLSGTTKIKLNALAEDKRGLFQVKFEIEPVSVYVIPRATYAAWIAKRYLAGTRPGTLPLISNIEALKPMFGLKRGIEYYGSQLYQPGDSLKNIDWKHSLNYNELISKEFTEFQGQTALILVNLVVSNADEADKLAYKIISTALSLAHENIPSAFSAYDDRNVLLTTMLLQAQGLVLKSLQIAQEMITVVNPVKYLNPPDVTRLRANIGRIKIVENEATRVLGELLRIEYQNLVDASKLNPATRALTESMNKVNKQSNIVIISNRNHDAEALAFHTFNLSQRGNSVITI